MVTDPIYQWAIVVIDQSYWIVDVFIPKRTFWKCCLRTVVSVRAASRTGRPADRADLWATVVLGQLSNQIRRSWLLLSSEQAKGKQLSRLDCSIGAEVNGSTLSKIAKILFTLSQLGILPVAHQLLWNMLGGILATFQFLKAFELSFLLGDVSMPVDCLPQKASQNMLCTRKILLLENHALFLISTESTKGHFNGLFLLSLVSVPFQQFRLVKSKWWKLPLALKVRLK